MYMYPIDIYFKDIIFTLVDNKEGYNIYAACVSSMLEDGSKHYILAFSLDTHSKSHIDKISWVNIQTRKIKNGYHLPPQRLEIPKNVEDVEFRIIQRTTGSSTYTSIDERYEMILLHDPKKKSKYQWYDRMWLIRSLLTFSCVLSVKYQQDFEML